MNKGILSMVRRAIIAIVVISDKGMASVSRINGLKRVWLSGNNPTRRNNFIPPGFDLKQQKRITDKTLSYISQCASLEELRAYDIAFTAEGLRALYNHPNLKVLVLVGVDATAQDVAQLRAHLPNCRVDITTFKERMNEGVRSRGDQPRKKTRTRGSTAGG